MCWVDTVPYDLENVVVKKNRGFLAHVDGSGSQKVVADVLMKQKRTSIKLLSLGQVDQLLSAISNIKLRLMVLLGLQAGLRKEEILTFPAKYVVNPSRYKGSQFIPVILNPPEIETKGSHQRTIHIPKSLMALLWDYVVHERSKIVNKTNSTSKRLFLRNDGNGLSSDARTFNNQLTRLNLPFKVNPHMLRHTYATHTLKALMQLKDISFEPLLYLRDRLGHSSITTTEKYLHFLHELEDNLRTKYQDEISNICQGINK